MVEIDGRNPKTMTGKTRSGSVRSPRSPRRPTTASRWDCCRHSSAITCARPRWRSSRISTRRRAISASRPGFRPRRAGHPDRAAVAHLSGASLMERPPRPRCAQSGGTSLLRQDGSSSPLYRTTQLLGLNPSTLRRNTRGRRDTLSATLGCALQQLHQSLHGVGAIHGLGTMAPSIDDDHTCRGGPGAGQRQRARTGLVVERRGARRIEAKLDRRRHLVDVLSTRARRPNEAEFEFIRAQRKR